MSEFRHFRITLHLTHFFQDHRSLCKIFVNENMKNVGDLQNHIQKIFKIKDFYFISHGHYIPPSEDIRVLHPDDIIIAIPTNYSTTDICITNTATAKKSVLKEKHTKQYLEDGEDLSNCVLEDNSHIYVKKKKKRKRMTMSNIPDENEEEKLYSKKKDSVLKHNIETDVNNSDGNEYQKDLKNDISQSEKCEKVPREQNVSNDSPTSSMKDINQSDNNNTVSYIKKQLLNDQLINREKSVYEANIIANDKVDYCEYEVKKGNLSLETKEKGENSFNSIKNKIKLFNHKLKPDVKCNDQAKNLNINNILVSEIPSTTNISEDFSRHGISNMYKTNDQMNLNYILQGKDNAFIIDSKKSLCKKQITSENSEEFNHQINNSFNDKHKQIINIKSITDAISECEEGEFRKVASNSNYLFKSVNDNSINTLENSNLRESNNGKIEDTSTSHKEINKSEEKLENKSISFVQKYIGNTKQVNKPPLSKNLDIPFPAKDVYHQDLNTCSEENALPDIDHACSTVSFITKRKRKRTHRKRKSKQSVNNSPVSFPAESYYDRSLSHSSAISAVHIKFNDNGEPINFSEKQKKIEECSRKESSEVIDNSMNSTIQTPQPDEILKLDRSLDENKSLVINNINHISINDTNELGDKLSNSSSVLSEDTILKSPIMTSTKPKMGDLIAFKILRLTENYTPEISKHIIAEILSFNDITSNVDLKIIDGLDQCVPPGGKFSIEDNDKELSCMKSYCWTSLIEPRLIFP